MESGLGVNTVMDPEEQELKGPQSTLLPTAGDLCHHSPPLVPPRSTSPFRFGQSSSMGPRGLSS